MNGCRIEARNLRYAYPDGTRALNGVTFEVAAGEAVAVVGANGSGKSTLLRHLNGGLLPSAGEIDIGNSRLGPGTVGEIRRRVGLVFQDPDDQLFMPTVGEDVAFGPLNMGLPPGEVERRVAAALARVGAERVRDRPPYRLSAGEKRAAAIAGVLAMEPDVLVMDEPSSHLDPRGRRRLIETLRSFEHTRLIATHDLELAVAVCASVLVLDGGEIVARGPVREVLDDEPLMLAHGLERPHSLRHPHPH